MPPTAETITFQGETATLPGYLARPEGDGPFPAVVVIHEIFGLNEQIRDVARRCAVEGYVALAVDLFGRRNRALCMLRFFSGMRSNSLDHVGIRDLKAALTFLAEQPGVDSERLGAIGFCMGGSFAVAWACADNRLKVIAPYYAMNPRPFEAVKRSCPVVGSYPGKDFTTAHGQKLDVALEQYEIKHDIKVYPGAKHSFFNDQRPRSYDAATSDDSWKRVLAFFQEQIG